MKIPKKKIFRLINLVENAGLSKGVEKGELLKEYFLIKENLSNLGYDIKQLAPLDEKVREII